MDQETSKRVEQFIESVSKHEHCLVSAFIFGSYVRGTQHNDSYIDVALVIEGLSDNQRFDTQVRLMMIASRFDTRIEPHPISLKDLNSNNPFSVEIKKTGLELSLK